MLVAEYMVDFLIRKNVKDIFGYPGGMVTYLMEALSKRKDSIKSRLTYNEQGAALAACGYAQVTGSIGVAYATSGPGATNLLTGIANAYFDSIPCMFITGQVNTYEAKGSLLVRQQGFQEMDVVEVVDSISKYAVKINNPNMIRYELEKAYCMAMSSRKGPVVIDIPMNIQRAEINPNELPGFNVDSKDDNDYSYVAECIFNNIRKSKRPVVIAGAGIATSGCTIAFRELVNKLEIPIVTSMIGIDCIPTNDKHNMGFIGAYGHRCANIIVAKADIIITLGTRLDCRQVGVNRREFAPNAKILRIDIDSSELENKVGKIGEDFCCDLKQLFEWMLKIEETGADFSQWTELCLNIKSELSNIDENECNKTIEAIGNIIPDGLAITTDVGQNQVWVAQSLKIKDNQRLLFSGGHGAMGYSLPAAIGVCYAMCKPTICFTGDGGLQMNIQELQMIVRDKLPIKIVLINNGSLGMIRHFQEMYFDGNYTMTTNEGGFINPDFVKLANAYGIRTINYHEADSTSLKELIIDNLPALINVDFSSDTYVFPKLAINKPVYDQDPLLKRDMMNKIMEY